MPTVKKEPIVRFRYSLINLRHLVRVSLRSHEEKWYIQFFFVDKETMEWVFSGPNGEKQAVAAMEGFLRSCDVHYLEEDPL